MASGPINAIKANFFDTEKIVKLVEDSIRRPLSRFGAYVRQRARSSIRKRKSVSKPGNPPTSWSGLLRQFIWFSYDPSTKSVVAGAVPFKSNSKVPSLLEHGGTVPGNGREIWITNDVGRDAKGKFVSGGKSKIVLNGEITYRPRPYMAPAFQAELPGFLRSLKDSVR